MNLDVHTYVVKSELEIVSDSYRYVYCGSEISMLKPCAVTNQTYEIYCREGGLFERFTTQELAEKRIAELFLKIKLAKFLDK